ncbi:MAG: PAP2 family protein [Candidatus Gottesmanbacteria bacterium GW2011_GWA2_43_14]|uniref:PAP2 family protein n=1 Tax=Candidatus Gottesmanbacteria bacterium GW2011_GWA2_43_14 TaxID=1618443 RepID=A0A0G1DBX1_9BACT|nr:MAG: PAP2 family protein [Candidatus Gottesmanbacteria bacterium GW2011_GWA2_43_14]
MWQSFEDLDKAVFLAVNHLPHNFLTDSFFLFFSLIGFYGFVWFAILIILFLIDGLDNRKEILALLLALVVEVILVELAMKNIFIRARPETAFPEEVLILIPKSTTFSFPSGHASLSFAGAYILSVARRKKSKFFFLLAFLVAVSRVYLGKHYPGDIIAGSLVGLLIGFLAVKIVGLSGYVSKKRKK